MDKAGLGYYAIYEPHPGTDFWRITLAIGGEITGWPQELPDGSPGEDGFTHLIQQIKATAETRRTTKRIFGIKGNFFQ